MPATTLVIKKSKTGEEVTAVDVVACVGGRVVHPRSNVDLVAKPYKRSDPDDHEDCWRVSESRRERKRLRKVYRKKPYFLTLTKIIKILRIEDSQFGQFPTYFYKNLLLMLLGYFSHPDKWRREDMDSRFADLMQLLHYVLRTGRMTVFYNKEEDLLGNVSFASYKPLQNRLLDAIENDNYIKLLENIP